MSLNQTYSERDQRVYLRSFNRYPVTAVSGQGSRFVDAEGNEYIDALAGIAVNALGHSHPRLVDALTAQAKSLMHVSNFVLTEPQLQLSERLVALSGMDRVFLTNSGAESVEACIKIARKAAHARGRGGTVLFAEGSFHGRTMATLAMGKPAYAQGFEPIPEGFRQVAFNDLEALRAAITDDVGALILEPIQGEGGVRPARPCYLRAAAELCQKEGIVLIFDEVQTGVGRTGAWFAKDRYDVQPDLMALAKGLGGGFPVGAALARESVAKAIVPGDHGSTFGGNPMACAAALTVLDVIEEEDLCREAHEKGRWLRRRIEKIGHPGIQRIRGKGLMLGLVCGFNTKPLAAAMLERGVLANSTAGNVLRFVPALNIPYADLEAIVEALADALEALEPATEPVKASAAAASGEA